MTSAEALFPLLILDIQLQLALSQIDVPAARDRLRGQAAAWPEAREQAALAYELWRLGPEDVECRAAAAGHYYTLYSQTPTREYRQRYQSLQAKNSHRDRPYRRCPDLSSRPCRQSRRCYNRSRRSLANWNPRRSPGAPADVKHAGRFGLRDTLGGVVG